MKHQGKASKAGLRIMLLSLVVFVLLITAILLSKSALERMATFVAGVTAMWGLFAGFVVNFFRDPSPKTPATAGVYTSPAHGKVDVVDEVDDPGVMGGRCRRVSIFLSVFDVHIQYAPIAGTVTDQTHRPGQFLNALSPESALKNEHVLLGFDSTEVPGERVGVRLIAGLIARRIVPWTSIGDRVTRGERISLIQFGSRVNLYLPMTTRVVVKVGDRVRGGETVIAERSA